MILQYLKMMHELIRMNGSGHVHAAAASPPPSKEYAVSLSMVEKVPPSNDANVAYREGPEHEILHSSGDEPDAKQIVAWGVAAAVLCGGFGSLAGAMSRNKWIGISVGMLSSCACVCAPPLARTFRRHRQMHVLDSEL